MMNCFVHKFASLMNIEAWIIDDKEEKERIQLNSKRSILFSIFNKDNWIEGIENSTSPFKR